VQELHTQLHINSLLSFLSLSSFPLSLSLSLSLSLEFEYTRTEKRKAHTQIGTQVPGPLHTTCGREKKLKHFTLRKTRKKRERGEMTGKGTMSGREERTTMKEKKRDQSVVKMDVK
jgi:hypothetical protein